MVAGTRQFHCYTPGPVGVVLATELSNNSLPKKRFVIVPSSFTPFDISTVLIDDFVVVSSESEWWIARVKDIEDEQINVTFFESANRDSGRGYTMITPRREEAVYAADVIFNLRATCARRTRFSKFYDLSAEVHQELKVVIQDFNLFKDQQQN